MNSSRAPFTFFNKKKKRELSLSELQAMVVDLLYTVLKEKVMLYMKLLFSPKVIRYKPVCPCHCTFYYFSSKVE